MTCSIRPLAFPSRIIGALLLVLLAGCSAVRIGYNNAPAITYWWLDSYIDFDTPQAQPVRASLDALHAWHRKNELPLYAETLHKLQTLAPLDVTPAQICAVWDEVQAHTQRLGDAAAAGISAFTPGVRREQLRHLAVQFDKRNEKWREEWMDAAPAALEKRRLKQAVERAEMFYDRLEDAQLAILRERIARSSFDAHLTYREILRRQADILQVLTEHSLGGATRGAAVQTEVGALLERLRRSPDPVYRAQQEKMTIESCATIAALHNSTSRAQRESLAQRLKGYEDDLRALQSQP